VKAKGTGNYGTPWSWALMNAGVEQHWLVNAGIATWKCAQTVAGTAGNSRAFDVMDKLHQY